MNVIQERLAAINLDRRLALRVPETAEVLGISRSKAYDLIGRQVIPSIRLAGSIRVPVDALKKLLEVL
jgi:excisionase family DNA binding protein